MEGNPRLKLHWESAQACRLQLLTLDAMAAAQNSNVWALASMAHLQQLHISNSAGAVPAELANIEGVHLLAGPSSSWRSQQKARRAAAGNIDGHAARWNQFQEVAAKSEQVDRICGYFLSVITMIFALSELGIL